MKFKVRSPKSEVLCSKSGRGPKSEVGVWRLKWSAWWRSPLISSSPDPHNIYYNVFLEFIWLHMYVCFCCVTNKLSESLSPKFDVWRCLTMKLQSDVWSISEVHNPKSENWCQKSTIGSLMYEVWRNLSVRKLSELCPNSEVLSMSVQNLESKNQSLKSKVCLKFKIRVWNQSLKSVSSVSLRPKSNGQNLKWKSEVESLSEVGPKFFCNYYNLCHTIPALYIVFVDQLWQ